ncbi:MAG: hypothetical protein IPL01_15740 [Acidobacteria bacterium]|nr:hypothetical protein [Acidobacteriota bacterium]
MITKEESLRSKGKVTIFFQAAARLRRRHLNKRQCEVREELACELRIINQIGKAVQFFQSDGQNYRMEAVFFEGELIGVISETAEYELCWLDVGQIEEGFYHKCQVWAVKQLRNSKRYGGHLQET